MHLAFALTDKVDPIAVYATVVATLVFGWNVYVWLNSGPRLQIVARDVGSKSTTITNVIVISYKMREQRRPNRPSFTAIFNNVGGNYPIPDILDVGHKFSSKADQEGLVDRIRDSYF
jgi:hypothetical protein